MSLTSMRRMAAFAVMTLALAPVTALADGPIPVLLCAAGEGCTQGFGKISETDTGVLYGQTVTPGQVAVVFIEGNPTGSLVPMAPDAVHQAYGGTGSMETLHLLPGSSPDELVLSFDEGGKEPIEVFAPQDKAQERVINLFPDAEDGEIVPRDGLWQVTSRDQTFTNCPAEMEAMLRGSGMIDAQSETHRLVWGGRFDPSVLNFMNGDGQQITWNQTAPNSFEGELFDVTSGPGKVAADVGMEITSPTQIDSYVDLFIGVLMGAEELAGLGLSDCKVYMTFDVQHVSD
ncbi:hypothetical protein JQW92_22365 [Sulfitobacter pseudonitzschiae]|uniref:hypothetical protein n=1 Tax=Pseudosulfitobacter pseudonitzschiae TaxID=1402135 RepID=UPI001AFACFAA|nr:hypothetical protein [Pseudosulfitobacter pseudonitzschiae]MBM1817919.1 hypothetical protein [Pseudosulfitobacter pseudonitzschiae]MBM1834977.1 hypothetical protein [Pseudosulfitobacter pseudonitzschiae]MBM1839778.1 hypothetical protein [Pseudosulfitobacter pseudonitzschiae]MBM1844692.1 hypothetical protein [Pseudosulfitobacter pseudonitzschiae]MBM1849464.1 hypothetical protein [Pseudosulfitobacter pseudonitzschiae]